MQHPLIFIKLSVSVPIGGISLGYSRNGTIRWSCRDLSSAAILRPSSRTRCLYLDAHKRGRRERREMLREEPFRRALRALSTPWRNSVRYRLRQRVETRMDPDDVEPGRCGCGRGRPGRLPMGSTSRYGNERVRRARRIYTTALQDTASTCLPRFSVHDDGKKERRVDDVRNTPRLTASANCSPGALVAGLVFSSHHRSRY